MNEWTISEIRILTKTAYWPVLRAELSGSHVVKAQALREAEAELPWRTHHSLKDRCYRISEELRDQGLPWVHGWKPPAMVGQTPNSPGVSATIRAGALPLIRHELRPFRPGL